MYTSVEFHDGNTVSFYEDDREDMDDVLIEIPKDYELVLKDEEPEYDGSKFYIIKKPYKGRFAKADIQYSPNCEVCSLKGTKSCTNDSNSCLREALKRLARYEG